MTQPINFDNLNFDAFKVLAENATLSRHEKVGFPDSYREGRESAIFNDMIAKLPSLHIDGGVILEVGPGCSELPVILANHCLQHNQKLLLVDSAEMLHLLPDMPSIEKIPGKYPDIPHVFEHYTRRINTIIAYSVIQYVFAEGNLWDFLDRSLSLLADGGEILFGDIPNATMRKRFFSSKAGIQCHQNYTARNELPSVSFNQLEQGQMDDSVVFSILSRARAQGFHAWVVPQAGDLPMANRREDILIRKP